MGRHKLIPCLTCQFCGLPLTITNPKGKHRKYHSECAKEKHRLYHNELRKKQWREDPVYRMKCIVRAKAYQERMKGESEG